MCDFCQLYYTVCRQNKSNHLLEGNFLKSFSHLLSFLSKRFDVVFSSHLFHFILFGFFIQLSCRFQWVRKRSLLCVHRIKNEIENWHRIDGVNKRATHFKRQNTLESIFEQTTLGQQFIQRKSNFIITVGNFCSIPQKKANIIKCQLPKSILLMGTHSTHTNWSDYRNDWFRGQSKL